MDVERCVTGVRDGRAPYPGAEEREVCVVAPVERQVHDLLSSDDLPAIARFGLQEPRGPFDGHRLADAADGERQVHTLACVDGDGDVAGLRRREPLELRSHGVGADADVEELVVAVLIGHGCCRDAGADVTQCHGCAWHDAL